MLLAADGDVTPSYENDVCVENNGHDIASFSEVPEFLYSEVWQEHFYQLNVCVSQTSSLGC